MQTDEDAQPAQGDTQKQTEEKTPNESEEMEVRWSFSVEKLMNLRWVFFAFAPMLYKF